MPLFYVIALVFLVSCASTEEVSYTSPEDFPLHVFQPDVQMVDSSPEERGSPADFYGRKCTLDSRGSHYSKTAYFCE